MSVEFTVESAGGVASRVTVGGHPMLFDQPAVVGGMDAGPSPFDVFVVTAGACAHYFAAAFLHARGFSTDGLVVHLRAEKALGTPKRLAALSLRVRLPAGVPSELRARVEAAVRTCPVWGTLTQPPTLSLEVG